MRLFTRCPSYYAYNLFNKYYLDCCFKSDKFHSLAGFELRAVFKPKVCLHTVISLPFELCNFTRISATVLEKYMYYQRTCDEEEWLHLLWVMMLPNQRDTEIPFSHSRAVVPYAGRPYTNWSFQLWMKVCPLVRQKETAMCIWSHNSPFVSHVQFLPRKYTSPTVKQSFNM